MSSSSCVDYFNPRTREGCDRHVVYVGLAIPAFQSTHPRGVRLDGYDVDVTYKSISIHAPARGATRLEAVEEDEEKISIHAPARGATAV